MSTDVPPQTLGPELDRARYRLELAKAGFRAAETAVVIEERRVRLLEAHVAAGPGHVFTPDPNPTVPTNRNMRMPECRLCRALIHSDPAHTTCKGDRHQCMATLPAGVVTPTGFRQWARPGMLCGQPGSFAPDYTAWACTLGHITTAEHVDDPEQCLRACPCAAMPANDGRRQWW